MRNFFKIILLLVILFAGFLVFRSFQNKSNVENHTEVIENNEIRDDVKNNEINEEVSTDANQELRNDEIQSENDEIDNKEEKEIQEDVRREVALANKKSEDNKVQVERKAESIEEKKEVRAINSSDISTLQENDVYIGNKKANVLMIEYDSLTCPHCKVFSEEIFPRIKAEYIDTGKVLYVTRPFPTDGISFRLSLMVECLDNNADKLKLRSVIFFNQGKIEEAFKGVNFKDQSDENKNNIDKRARGLIDSMVESFTAAGFDGNGLKQCGTPESQDPKTQVLVKRVLDDSRKAYESSYKIEATPAFLINGKKYDGAQNLQYWRDILNNELDLAAKKSLNSNSDSSVSPRNNNEETKEIIKEEEDKIVKMEE